MNKITNYLRESIAELRKVSWPTKKQTTAYTLIVLALSIGIALFFALLDWMFNLGLEKII
ncbi:MAG: preprotein translocase subunit SecE [Candidatus Magasanikbacteria bacterium]